MSGPHDKGTTDYDKIRVYLGHKVREVTGDTSEGVKVDDVPYRLVVSFKPEQFEAISKSLNELAKITNNKITCIAQDPIAQQRKSGASHAELNIVVTGQAPIVLDALKSADPEGFEVAMERQRSL